MTSPTRREIVDYDTSAYPFADEVAAITGTPELSQIHKGSAEDGAVERLIHSQFGRLVPLYESFIHRVVFAALGDVGSLCFQAVPTFRIHRPGGRAVQEFHVDTKYHHQPEVLNFWVPLTPATGTNSVWVESVPGAADYSPVDIGVGQLLCFHATRLAHGNQANTTGRTRVSFDLRVIPLDLFRPTGTSTVNQNVPIKLGGYYALMHPDGQVEHRSSREGDPR